MRKCAAVSAEPLAASLTLACIVEIPIAFGMTSAVIFFSIDRISEKGMTSWKVSQRLLKPGRHDLHR